MMTMRMTKRVWSMMLCAVLLCCVGCSKDDDDLGSLEGTAWKGTRTVERKSAPIYLYFRGKVQGEIEEGQEKLAIEGIDATLHQYENKTTLDHTREIIWIEGNNNQVVWLYRGYNRNTTDTWYVRHRSKDKLILEDYPNSPRNTVLELERVR